MSRYIDADALKKEIKQDIADNGLTERYVFYRINDAPSIEIVRCKECKYCVDAGAQRALVCDNSYIDMEIHPDDFCSYGERREP